MQCQFGSILSSEKNCMLIFGCTLPNLAIICPHKCTNEKFYPICQSGREFCEKVREVMMEGPSVVLTQKAVVDETFIRVSPKPTI